MISAERKLVKNIAILPEAIDFINKLNLIRMFPGNYSGLDLSKYPPANKLIIDSRLMAAAQSHSEEMSKFNYFSHNDLAGHDPGYRLTHFGFAWQSYGESIAKTITNSADDCIKQLLIDKNVPTLGHRLHLLGVSPTKQNAIGVGWSDNYWTIDTGNGNIINTNWIDRLFNLILGHSASAEAIAYWESQPSETVVSGIMNSIESRSRIVTLWALRFGLSNFDSVNYPEMLLTETEETVLGRFLFDNLNKNKSKSDIVKYLYQVLLNRLPLGGEDNYWLYFDVPFIIFGFLHSQEYRKLEISKYINEINLNLNDLVISGMDLRSIRIHLLKDLN